MTATFLTSQNDFTPDPRVPHVVLVGLPGSGKSTVGPALAARGGRGFLDFDAEIERREGRSIAQIFAENGEHYFRQKERALTEELKATGNMVLAPGGGWITEPENVALLRPPARIIYLKVRPETALKRLGPERATRPLLLRPDPLGEMKRLLVQRAPLYEAADYTIETDSLAAPVVVTKAAELIVTLRGRSPF
ncbi:MAG: shikimate kinase [Gemmatimonadaceae bacterium]